MQEAAIGSEAIIRSEPGGFVVSSSRVTVSQPGEESNE